MQARPTADVEAATRQLDLTSHEPQPQPSERRLSLHVDAGQAHSYVGETDTLVLPIVISAKNVSVVELTAKVDDLGVLPLSAARTISLPANAERIVIGVELYAAAVTPTPARLDITIRGDGLIQRASVLVSVVPDD